MKRVAKKRPGHIIVWIITSWRHTSSNRTYTCTAERKSIGDRSGGDDDPHACVKSRMMHTHTPTHTAPYMISRNRHDASRHAAHMQKEWSCAYVCARHRSLEDPRGNSHLFIRHVWKNPFRKKIRRKNSPDRCRKKTIDETADRCPRPSAWNPQKAPTPSVPCNLLFFVDDDASLLEKV